MRNFIVLGCGTVGKCLLALLARNPLIAHDRIIVADKKPEPAEFSEYALLGMRYVRLSITPDNLAALLAEVVAPGDLLINLSVSVRSLDVADWCQLRGAMYLDTGFEPWEEDIFGSSQQPHERTQYWEHYTARRHAARWQAGGPTAIFSHGANPGLVSHYAKAGLIDYARAARHGRTLVTPTTQSDWAALARSLDVRVLHISEQDSQITSVPKQVDEFVNTWSIYGFLEEATRPVEIGWGSHEAVRPPTALEYSDGPRNCIYMPMPAYEFHLKSWVPGRGAIEGLALPHSETVTISEYFTLQEEGRTLYRPTVAYCYLPCDAALASLHEARMKGWTLPARVRVLEKDIVDGVDELGVLILGGTHGGWWFGSQLSIAQVRTIAPGSNAAALLVAAGAYSAAKWMVRNPCRGYLESDQLPYDEVLEAAAPYLGNIVSTKTDWMPEERSSLTYSKQHATAADPFQFRRFVVDRDCRGAPHEG